MKNILVMLLVLTVLLMAACQIQTSIPTEPPIQPTNGPADTSPTDSIEDPRFAEFDTLFGDFSSWYNRALLCEYASPTDIALSELFYNGFRDESHKPTDAEWEALKDHPDLLWMGDMMRLPAEKMDQVLTQYFGIHLTDVKKSGFDYLVYLESTNCYYMVNSDAHSIYNFKTTGIETLDGGNIRMSYEADGVSCVAVLKPVGNGYQILSNKMIGHPVAAGDILLKEYEALFADAESWYRQALICQYASPSQINLKAFFYNGFEDEDRTPTDEEQAALQSMPGIDLNLDLIRLPAEKMDAVLNKVFDFRLSWLDATAFEGLVYLESTNCYYHTTSDTRRTERFEVTGADMQLDYRKVRLYYTLDDGQTYAVMIWPLSSGYRILSNQKA